MKRVLLIVIAMVLAIRLFGFSIFSFGNNEKNISVEERYNAQDISEIITDLSTEDLTVKFSSNNDIVLKIYGYTSKGDIDDFLEYGITRDEFYIKHKSFRMGWFNKYSIKIELLIPNRDYDKISMDTSTGKIYFDESINSQLFIVDSSTGAVNLGTIDSREIDINTSTGNIEIMNIYSQRVKIDTSTGKIIIRDIESKEILISSSTGNIEINKAIGDINIDTSTGSVDINETLGNIEISSSTGDVLIGIDKSVGYTFDIDTSTGEIDIQMPITVNGKIKKNSLNGTINNGENKLTIDSSTGDIIVKHF